jgi:hypothetical protein
MKIFKFFLFYHFFIFKVLALEALVISFEAPLLKEPNTNAIVLQRLRQNDVVRVPDSLKDSNVIPEFIQTFDKAGNTTYIQSKFLKIIFHNEKENQTDVSLSEKDPTNYLIPEPISKKYPFLDKHYLRASVLFSMGTNNKSPYAYNRTLTAQDYSWQGGGTIIFAKKDTHDLLNRLYYGIITVAQNTKNNFVFKDSTYSMESRSSLRVGPYISYDIFQSEKYNITYSFGSTLNFHQSTLTFTDTNNLYEDKIFRGFSFSPMVSIQLQYNNVLGDMDFLIGANLYYLLGHSLNSISNSDYPAFWPSNSLKENGHQEANLYIGIQGKY